MSKHWEYQLRIDLGDDLAEAARRDPNDPAIKPLADILTRAHADSANALDGYLADRPVTCKQRTSTAIIALSPLVSSRAKTSEDV